MKIKVGPQVYFFPIIMLPHLRRARSEVSISKGDIFLNEKENLEAKESLKEVSSEALQFPQGHTSQQP